MSSSDGRRNTIRVGIAGNPNSGKTSLFNALTGSRQHVGNWPGVTVEKKSGFRDYRGYAIEFIDLPGTYSLAARSVEELVARSFILNENPDLILNIVDASNIERNLFLTAQLIELGVKMVVCLNMMDAARERRIEIRPDILADLIGAPVVETNGRKGTGLDPLLAAVVDAHENKALRLRHIHINYGPEIEKGIEKLAAILKQDERVYAFTYECDFTHDEDRAHRFPIRWLCTRLLIGDERVADFVRLHSRDHAAIETVIRIVRDFVQLKTDSPVDAVLSDRVYAFIRGLVREAVDFSRSEEDTLTERLDRLLTHRVLGIPIFFVLVWGMFQLTFTGGDLLAQPLERLLDAAGGFARAGTGVGLFHDFMVHGVIQGVGSVLLFLPNIAILFLCIAFLEDTGYMARAAFLMDRFMHVAGLHGKSFIALFMGFGCNAPAIMACRTLENRSDRLITMMIVPLMSCSARFPVYILFAGTFFPEHAGSVIFLIYLTGIGLAALVANVFRRTLFRDESAPFVLELPPYRLPAARNLLLNMWDKVYVFVKKAGTVILLGVALVWVLTSFPKTVTFSQNYDEKIATVEGMTRTVAGGLEQKFTAAVAELRARYTHPIIPFDGSREYLETADYYRVRREEIFRAATAEIAAIRNGKAQEIAGQRYAGRIGKAIEPLIRPLGFDWRAGISLLPGFVAKEVVVGSFAVLYLGDEEGSAKGRRLSTALTESGAFTPLSALSFMLFTLIYAPCLATVTVIRKESGALGWALLSIAYSFGLAWVVSFAVYQGGLLLGYK